MILFSWFSHFTKLHFSTALEKNYWHELIFLQFVNFASLLEDKFLVNKSCFEFISVY